MIEHVLQKIAAWANLQTKRHLILISGYGVSSTLISANKKRSIIEGMTASFIESELFDLRIYFYTDDATEFTRRLSRDIEKRGKDLESLLKSQSVSSTI